MENSFFHLFILAVHLITFYNVFGRLVLDKRNKAKGQPIDFNMSSPRFAWFDFFTISLDKINHLLYNATGCT